MNSTIPEGPFRGPSPTRPAPGARRLHTMLAAFAVAASLLVGWTQPVAAQSPTKPIDVTAAGCVAQTQLTKLTTSGGPFDGGTKITWAVTKPTTAQCSSLAITMNGSPIALNGSITVDPATTTKYSFAAKMGTASKSLGTTVALSADIVGYSMTRGGNWTPRMNPTSAAADEARAITRKIIGILSPASKLNLVGLALEIHIIPAGASLTALPPWKDAKGKMTCEEKNDDGTPNKDCVYPRLWSEVRGVGGSLISGTNRIATAVGEESLVNIPGKTTKLLGHTLAHELGHTLLDFAAPNEKANVKKVLDGNADNHDYIGDDAYTSWTPHEYFAEGVAALFNEASAKQWVGQFTPKWLKNNEPDLYKILTRVFTVPG